MSAFEEVMIAYNGAIAKVGTEGALHVSLRDAISGDAAKVSTDGKLWAELPPLISTNNSTDTPLGIGGVFTGTADEINGYGIIYINVYSDQGSATDGLQVEQSSNGTNWDHCDEYTIPAAKGKNFSINPFAKYMRVIYTNGGIAQTEFRLQVIMKNSGKPSSHRIQDPIVDEDDAELVKAVITGLKDDGVFDNATLTRKGHLKISLQEYGDTASIDAFARQRMSEPFTLIDSKLLHSKSPLIWDEMIAGSATSVHSDANSRVRMTVTANAADYVIRQTFQRFNYQTGKSQLIMWTLVSPEFTGVTCQSGYFSGRPDSNHEDPEDGIFLETGGVPSWNIAKSQTVTETYTKPNWNIDTLDGSGDDNNPSGILFNANAGQIAFTDFEFLGLGRVRCGFFVAGLPVYTHEFLHANAAGFDSVYMSTPNLPLRYVIKSDGTGGGYLDHFVPNQG